MASGRLGTASLVTAGLVLALAIAGCLEEPGGGDGARERGVTVVIGFEGFSPDAHPGKRATWRPVGDNWSLTLEDAGDNGTVYYVHNVTGGNVLEALLRAGEVAGFEVREHREGMGAFVDSIDGVENGRDGHYWSYYLNDEYGTVASDMAAVDDGDEVRWVYMGNPFG